MTRPPVCDYEGSDYQSSFWDRGEREYEDRVEAIALRRLLPKSGKLMLELGAGAGRNSSRYANFRQIILVDYSRTQLEQAQARLGTAGRYIYVMADIYSLPFVEGLFDGATMIRTLHHMADAPAALAQVRSALAPHATFILEYANKLNLKAIVRFWLGIQKWDPFALAPVEFAAINFDFHPNAIRRWLQELGFVIEKTLAVSHFRSSWLKRTVPINLLVGLDSVLQWTGLLWQLTPSIFVSTRAPGEGIAVQVSDVTAYFKCPHCGHSPLIGKEAWLECPACGKRWRVSDGIYNFREPLN